MNQIVNKTYISLSLSVIKRVKIKAHHSRDERKNKTVIAQALALRS